MTAIRACRTAALGGHVTRCADCDHTIVAYNSCRNRHCPKCQGAAAKQWLAAREADLLPVPYYHVVFTLPAAVPVSLLRRTHDGDRGLRQDHAITVAHRLGFQGRHVMTRSPLVSNGALVARAEPRVRALQRHFDAGRSRFR